MAFVFYNGQLTRLRYRPIDRRGYSGHTGGGLHGVENCCHGEPGASGPGRNRSRTRRSPKPVGHAEWRQGRCGEIGDKLIDYYRCFILALQTRENAKAEVALAFA
jgi:hypothetical protein